MTKQPPKIERQRPTWAGSPCAGSTQAYTDADRRTNAEAIKAAWDYLLSSWRKRHWEDFGAEPLGTACVLARLGGLPSDAIDRQKRGIMEQSLDWLLEARTPDGGWGCAGAADAETTAWALIALRRNRRQAPASALDLLHHCRRRDGGFAVRPAGGPSDPEATVLAIQALGWLDPAAETFLFTCLQSDTARLPSPLGFFLPILEWEKGLAPLALLNQACQLVVRFAAETALEQALLLHCLVRLRLNRAWPQAASLRAAQLDDGSWPGPSMTPLNCDGRNIIPTVTAVSALVLGESQPGLYFGADSPRPRRLYES